MIFHFTICYFKNTINRMKAHRMEIVLGSVSDRVKIRATIVIYAD